MGRKGQDILVTRIPEPGEPVTNPADLDVPPPREPVSDALWDLLTYVEQFLDDLDEAAGGLVEHVQPHWPGATVRLVPVGLLRGAAAAASGAVEEEVEQ